MTAQTKKYQFVVFVFLFVDGKHYSVGVAKFAISVYSIKNACKGFWKITKVVGESGIGSPLLFVVI